MVVGVGVLGLVLGGFVIYDGEVEECLLLGCGLLL